MTLIIIILFMYPLCDSVLSSYIKSNRDIIIDNELKKSLGGDIKLTPKEEIVNSCLMKHKNEELNYAFNDPEYFNFSKHFFSYRKQIKNSKVYQIIKDLPKGAALHVHDVSILPPDYLVNVTYKDNLYVCFENEKLVSMVFADTIPKKPCDKWQLMSEVRHSSRNVSKFDAELRKHFTLVVDDPDKVYPTIKESWTTFLEYFTIVLPLVSHRPIWEQYIYDALKAFRDSNIMYVEIRSLLPTLYEEDGSVYDQMVTAKCYKKAFEKFSRDFPDFVGGKLIFAPSRNVHVATVKEYIEFARKIKKEMPEAFAGFDLVGQEDAGEPLIEFLPELDKARDLNFFFHAGETDWNGFSTDENLIDAILLGAKRIGHGYALYKHPEFIQEFLKRDIAIEVNVISNAVLSLVRDVRNHPLSFYLANNLPVVISSDDPGVWEADVISDDFYVTFVAVANKNADLRMLKGLALNSIKYSTFSDRERKDVLEKFNDRWNTFIENFSCSNY